MVTSTASLLEMTAENIVRNLGPNEIIQYEISSNDWNQFFIDKGWVDQDDLPYDDEDMP
jgi:hypothetical protein